MGGARVRRPRPRHGRAEAAGAGAAAGGRGLGARAGVGGVGWCCGRRARFGAIYGAAGRPPRPPRPQQGCEDGGQPAQERPARVGLESGGIVTR